MDNETMATFTPDEVKFITECLLNCPLQATVKDMPGIIGMVQGIVGKMGPQRQQRIEEGTNSQVPVGDGGG